MPRRTRLATLRFLPPLTAHNVKNTMSMTQSSLRLSVPPSITMTETKCSTSVTTALLVLFSCNLALVLSKLPPPAYTDASSARVEPVSYIASKLCTVLVACISASAAHRGRRLSLDILLAELHCTWRRPAMTLLYIELLMTAMASLLLVLRAFLGVASGMVAEFLAVSCSVALVGRLGPVLFAHSDIACKMGLIVAVVEEGCEGGAAVERAEGLVAGRRTQGFVIAFAASMIEQAPAWWWRDGAHALVVGPAVLAAKFAACYACAAFYFECRRRHEKGSSANKSEFEDPVNCRDIVLSGGFNFGYQTDAEELHNAFEYFKLA